MLRSALEQNVEQRKITASGLIEARRRKVRGLAAVAAVITTHQAESIALAFGSNVDQLAEQDLDAPPVGTASLSSLISDPDAVVDRLGKVETEAKFAGLVQSLIVQASLTATAVDMMRRPAITKYVRVLVGSSCPRCAVLAGKTFTWKADFDRHPGCNCDALPTNDRNAEALVTDPMVAFRSGNVRGLSKADTEAINNGADLGRVVNVRKREAGLRDGSSVLMRVESLGRLRGGGRLVVDQMTPEAIRRVAATREEAIQLLGHHGYLRNVDAGKRGARIIDR
jgi:hypothetical protein